MTVHNYRPRQFHRTSIGENPSSGYRDMGSASLAAACPAARSPTRPPARTVTTIPLQPGGLRGKNYIGVASFQRKANRKNLGNIQNINDKKETNGKSQFAIPHIYNNCCLKDKPKSGPSYRKQMVQLRPQALQGESVA